MKQIIALLGLMVLIGLTSANSILIQPVYSWNSVSNSLVIHFQLINTSNGAVTSLNYGQAETIQLENMTINNVLINGSSSSSFAPDSKFIVQAPINNMPLAKNIVCVNGELEQFVNNVSINCPSSISNIITLNPSNITQTGTITPANNVSFHYTINAIPQANSKTTLAYANSIYFNTINALVTAQSLTRCNINQTVNASWLNSTVISNTTGPCNFTLKVNQIKKLDINKNLTSNQTYINNTYGLSFSSTYLKVNTHENLSFGQCWNYSSINALICAPNFDGNVINQSDIENYYNSHVVDNCLNYTTVYNANNVATFSYCSVFKNNTQPNILDVCTSPELRNTTGLTQCMNQAFLADNQSALSCHSQLANDSNQLNPTYVNGTTYQLNVCQTNEKTALIYPQILLGFMVGLIVLFIFLMAYTRRSARADRDQNRPRGKHE